MQMLSYSYTDDNFLKEKLCLHYTQNQFIN